MRTLLVLLISPCVISPSLIVGAFALDGLGTSGRIIGTIMIAVAMWGPDLLIAKGWAVECSGAKGRTFPLFEAPRAESEPAAPRRWWRRRYTLRSAPMVFIGGLGGFAVGCIISVHIAEPSLPSLLVWGGIYGVLGMMVIATSWLLDQNHPHHGRFETSWHQACRLAFIVLFALGFWQRFPAGLVIVLSGGLCAFILFTLGTAWNLFLLGQAAVDSFRCRSKSE